MKRTLRITALILAVCMLALICCSCSPTPSASESIPSSAPSLGDDTLIVTVDGSPVYWPEFRYWLNCSLQFCGFTPGSEIDWDAEYSDNLSLAEYIMNDAVHAVALYRVIDKTAETLELSISDSDMETIKTIMEENAAYFETDEEYQAYLEESCLSEELTEYLLLASCNYYNIFKKMFGEKGELVPDADALAFGAENGYYRVKHILLAPTDENGENYSDSEMQERYFQMESMLLEIKGADDPDAAFNELMSGHSDDPAYTDGFQFVRGDMADEFQAAVDALNDFEVSDIVTLADGSYTIIMRLPLDPDDTAISSAYGYTLRYTTANFEYESLANSWTAEANVELSDNYSLIDLDYWF